MDEFLEALRQQFSEEQIQNGQDLLEDILGIVNQNGDAGYLAGNLFYALMTDEIEAFVVEDVREKDDKHQP